MSELCFALYLKNESKDLFKSFLYIGIDQSWVWINKIGWFYLFSMELWHFIDKKVMFLLNILKMNGWILIRFYILFLYISWDKNEWFCSNFVYTLILLRFWFGLKMDQFYCFSTKLWFLIDVRIGTLLYILRTNWCIWIKIFIYIDTN